MQKAVVIKPRVKIDEAIQFLMRRNSIKLLLNRFTPWKEKYQYLDTVYAPFYLLKVRVKIKKILAGWYEVREICGVHGLRGNCAIIGSETPPHEEQEILPAKIVPSDFELIEIKRRVLEMFRQFVEKWERPVDVERYLIESTETCYLPLYIFLETGSNRIFVVDALSGETELVKEIPQVERLVLELIY